MRKISIEDLPVVTTEQMREVDRIMMEDLGISLIQMMENAGRSLAQLVLELYAPKSVTVLAGHGGNGGGGLVAARHLINRGLDLEVVIADPADIGVGATRLQLHTLRQMGARIDSVPNSQRKPDVVIDALIGYSLTGPPSGFPARMIAWARKMSRPIVSLDVPSGFDAQKGLVLTPCIRADATLTIAAPKYGLFQSMEAGRLFLTDISVPTNTYRRWGYSRGNIFEQESIVEIVD